MFAKCGPVSHLCRKGRVIIVASPSIRLIGRPSVRLYSSDRSKPEWDRAMSEAERIVDYPSSFANLRWLIGDEMENVALHLKKLVGSEHPILRMAKTLLYGCKNNSKAWGLLVLLMSKAVGNIPKYDQIIESVEVNGVLQSQRIYAEITELIRTGHLIHKCLVNIRETIDPKNNDILVYGNKIALLSGDYLISTANAMLCGLKDQHVLMLISSALRDLTEAEFVGERTLQNAPIPSKPEKSNNEIVIDINQDNKVMSIIDNARRTEPLDTFDCIGDPIKEWTMRNMLNGASLLGRGCEGALHLGGHDQKMQSKGYNFGCHVALAWQAAMDVKSFSSDGNETFSLVSAPVLFALEDDPTLYDKIDFSKGNPFDYDIFKTAVKKTTAIDKTINLYNENCMAAIKNIEDFPNTGATNALRKFISF